MFFHLSAAPKVQPRKPVATCTQDDVKDELLLHSRLFPATFKSIKTVFTFSVLDDFLRDNLECKTTAQQYYSKLQSTTSKMFPNLVPNLYKQLLRAACQWRDLKNRMEQGLGHQEGKDIQEGAMGVFCPACPQPGINLPDDWKHMKHRSGEKDIALSAGMGFMADPEPYKAHLQTRRQIDQPSTCNTYKAIEQANSNIPIALVMYDIMCQYRVNFQDRTGIGLFHIHGHQDSCLPRYSPSCIPRAKQKHYRDVPEP
ncbi:hypothetical protein EI94DRAFT_1770207 [Lactarius quietus]|nr:hypothetical protein EI94DRAFT_1770207 [Lactarius quietus]